jgi:hypothetical protein
MVLDARRMKDRMIELAPKKKQEAGEQAAGEQEAIAYQKTVI